MSVNVASLRHLVPGTTSTLPGLSVQCHLSGILPMEDQWTEDTINAMNKMISWMDGYFALVMDRSTDSLGIYIILEPGQEYQNYSTINQNLIEQDHARLQFPHKEKLQLDNLSEVKEHPEINSSYCTTRVRSSPSQGMIIIP